MKLILPEFIVKEYDGFNNDIFERQAFGEKLAQLMESASEGLVIALDAEWGEGKTTFIKKNI